jgi:glucose/mannose-6-phosphate isomerase
MAGMADASGIISEIKHQEKTGFFQSLRKKALAEKANRPDHRMIVQNLPFHIQNALKVAGAWGVHEPVDRIIIAGAGVNAIAGDLVRAHLEDYRHYSSVKREFILPDNVNSKTLVIVASYSGNDPEPLSCYRHALRKGCKVLGLTSGGRLLEALGKGSTERILLPESIPDESALVYIYYPILRVLENSGLIRSQKDHIEETMRSLRKPELSEMSRHLYEKLTDKIPIIFCSPRYAPVAEYWKYQFNVTARVPAFYNVFSDAAYSDLAGYAKDFWDFYTVFLTDQEDDADIQKSMLTAKKIIKNRGHGCTEIMVKGTNLMTRMLSAVSIADQTAIPLSDYYRIEADLISQYREDIRVV